MKTRIFTIVTLLVGIAIACAVSEVLVRVMLPLDLEVPERVYQFKDVPPQTLPDVDNSVWLTSDGSTIAVLINHTDTDYMVTIDLAQLPGWLAGKQAWRINEFDREEIKEQYAQIQIQALSMMAIEVIHDDV
jgi:hypothetical protein